MTIDLKGKLYGILDQTCREYMAATGARSIHIEIDITEDRPTTVKVMDIIRR